MDTIVGVKEKLVKLSRMRIIKYIPRVRTPLIIMNTERLVESNLYISQKRYDERKGLFKKRIESIISYVKETDICRSRQLIDYFGQPAEKDCGICDVCLKNRNVNNLRQRTKEVSATIIKWLQQEGGEMKITRLEMLAGDEYTFHLRVLREMIDNGEVLNKGDLIRIP